MSERDEIRAALVAGAMSTAPVDIREETERWADELLNAVELKAAHYALKSKADELRTRFNPEAAQQDAFAAGWLAAADYTDPDHIKL